MGRHRQELVLRPQECLGKLGIGARHAGGLDQLGVLERERHAVGTDLEKLDIGLAETAVTQRTNMQHADQATRSAV